MTSLFKKLNFKNHPHVVVLNGPDDFENELKLMESETTVLHGLPAKGALYFVLVFVRTLEEIQTSIKAIYPRLEGDAILWYAYPKASSKKYSCGFNRDTGWNALGQFDMEGVRQVAIDEDWSALRFRKVAFIKTLKRNMDMMLSKAGKDRR